MYIVAILNVVVWEEYAKEPASFPKTSVPIGGVRRNAAPFKSKISADIKCVISGDVKSWPNYSTLCLVDKFYVLLGREGNRLLKISSEVVKVSERGCRRRGPRELLWDSGGVWGGAPVVT